MSALNKSLEITEKDYQHNVRYSYIYLSTLFFLHVASVAAGVRFAEHGLYSPLCEEKDRHIDWTQDHPAIFWSIIVGIFYWPFPCACSLLISRQILYGLLLQMERFTERVAAQKSGKEVTITINEEGHQG